MDAYRDDAVRAGDRMISALLRQLGTEDRRAYDRWVKAVALFYGLASIIGGAALVASADRSHPEQELAEAARDKLGR
jgi:hypothetical protein